MTERAASSHGPEEPHGHSTPMPHHKVNYFAVFATLVVLTIVTVAATFIHTDKELVKILIALLIASIKATAVAMYFMHLKFERRIMGILFASTLILGMILVSVGIGEQVLPRP